MARKKVALAWISDDATRRTTLKKRRKSLLKKASELATLCHVGACAVVYGPHDGRPEVWPSESEAKTMLQQFKAMPEAEQSKKRVDQEGFLRQQILKLDDQIRKQRRENKEIEMTVMMYQGIAGRSLVDVGLEDAGILARLMEEKAKAVKERIEEERKKRWMMVEVRDPNPNFCPGPKERIEEAMMEKMKERWMRVEVRNPNPNPSSTTGPVNVQRPGFECYGGGYLDDVFMQQPCMAFGSPSAWLDPSTFYPF